MPLTAGTRLGSYEVVGLLGAGAMGEVYRGLDTKLGREVAVRILPELFALDPDRLARFEREAHVLAALNHPNIAALYGLEETDGVRGLVLELWRARHSRSASPTVRFRSLRHSRLRVRSPAPWQRRMNR